MQRETGSNPASPFLKKGFMWKFRKCIYKIKIYIYEVIEGLMILSQVLIVGLWAGFGFSAGKFLWYLFLTLWSGELW